jgi:hypothetical protein
MSEKDEHGSRPESRVLKAVLLVAIFVLLLLVLLLIAQYQGLKRENLIPQHHSILLSLKRSGTLAPQDANLIGTWMTFDYIDYLFSLSPSYLQTALSIDDPRYPHLTIEEYAEDAHLNLNGTLGAVQAAVRSYTPAQ